MPAGTVVRVRGATIAAVGPRAGASGAGGHEAVDLSGAEPVDLGGGTLLPGFIDAHVHPVFAGDRLVRCDLAGVVTAAEYLDIIAAYRPGMCSTPRSATGRCSCRTGTVTEPG